MGHVIQAGAGQITARQAAVNGGIPMTVPALTVNKVCLSGLNAIAMADQLIGYGEFDTVVAGGMESMTNGPYLLQKARSGYRYGDSTLVDATAYDALFCAFDHRGMGASTDAYSASQGPHPRRAGRVRRHEPRAGHRGAKKGLFDDEMAPVPVPQRKGDPLLVTEDEGVRPGTTARARQAAPGVRRRRHGHRRERLATVRRRRRRGRDEPDQSRATGSPGAGRDRRPRHRRRPPHRCCPNRPTPSRRRWADKASSPADVDLFEMNEAFAAVAIQSMRDLGVGPDVVNVNGGAIAMGHPVGASGARLALHLALELRRRGGGLGAAALCGGGGQGEALLLRVDRLTRPTPLEGTCDMADMNGQVALVTGGIRGIGAAIRDRLAARGMTIAAGYSRDKEAADLFRETHPGSSVHQGDIGAVEDCERVVSEVLSQHGRLDILVNNAGITVGQDRAQDDPATTGTASSR